MREDVDLAILKGRIRDLWASDLSSAKIAARLGVTKNVVVGHAHRMHLPSRPSPIVRDGVRREAAPAPAAVHPMAVLQQFGATAIPPRPAGARHTLPSAAPKPVLAFRPTQKCLWPMWGHHERAPMPPVYCDAPVATRGSRDGVPVWCTWCAEHARIGLTRSAPGYASASDLRRLAKTAA